jgi:hypothetical protein
MVFRKSPKEFLFYICINNFEKQFTIRIIPL